MLFEGIKLYNIIQAKYVQADESLTSHAMGHCVFIPLLLPNNFKIINNKIYFYNSKTQCFSGQEWYAFKEIIFIVYCS